MFKFYPPLGFRNTLRKNRKHGFSLVELIVVILIIAILAVAVFAGGSASIKKAQKARVTSDLHNFQIAVAMTMNENPQIANIDATTKRAKLSAIMESLNANLPADYKLTLQTDAMTGNINMDAQENVNADYIICKSDKTDAWDNPYFVILDSAERGGSTASEFYVTTVSAGPNAILNLTSEIDHDDVFDLTSYVDGDVISEIYDVSIAAPTIVGGAAVAITYINPATAPVNNGVCAEFVAASAEPVVTPGVISYEIIEGPYYSYVTDPVVTTTSDSVTLTISSFDSGADDSTAKILLIEIDVSAIGYPFNVTRERTGTNDCYMSEFSDNEYLSPVYSPVTSAQLTNNKLYLAIVSDDDDDYYDTSTFTWTFSAAS